jgi:Phytochelatin synthase
MFFECTINFGKQTHASQVDEDANFPLFLSSTHISNSNHIRHSVFAWHHQSFRMNSDRNSLLIAHNRAMETGEPCVMDTPEFHDNSLLRQAWNISPYNKHFLTYSTTKDNDVGAGIIQDAMCFQPTSGYCGLASVNTVLRSLDPPYHVRYPAQGRGYSMVSLAKYFILHCVPYHFKNVDVIFMEPQTTLEQFRTMIQQYANSPDYRLLANFHRTPLMYSQGSTDEEARWRAYAGHWSPVGGIISNEKGDYVLVLDTNPNYGPFMVSLERFFRAVKTETIQDGYRGFIKLRVNQ